VVTSAISFLYLKLIAERTQGLSGDLIGSAVVGIEVIFIVFAFRTS
jgi:cobalamin synthase